MLFIQYIVFLSSVFISSLILSDWADLSLFPLQRVNLSFDFPFYGHFLREITVATGGK